MAVGLFARYADGFVASDEAGLLYGGGLGQLAVQAAGAAIVAVWVLTTTGILFSALKAMGLLRVSAEEEMEGLDVAEHGSAGYGVEVTYA